jgi:subtilase family serine protease
MRRIVSGRLLTIAAVVPVVVSLLHAEGRSALTNHVRQATHNGEAKHVGPMPSDQILQLDVVLPVSDQAGLETFVKDVSDPNSPLFRHYLTPTEFTARFGPSAADYAAVVAYLKQNGFTVVGGTRDGMDVQIKGSFPRLRPPST